LTWGFNLGKISYIIGHKSNSKERCYNLDFVCKWIKNNFEISEIIVVEQSPSIGISNSTLDYIDKVISFENKNKFKRSLGFNLGYKNSNLDSEVFIFADNDIIFSTEAFSECLNFTKKIKGAASPYHEVINLEKDYKININDNINFHYANNNTRGGFAGGVIFIHRNSFEKIGGWDERFIGWGGEDNHFEEKIKKMNIPIFLFKKYPAYHLYHEVDDNSKNPFYEDNLKLFKDIERMSSKEVEKFCHNKINLIGDINYKRIK
jgi:predicted glycosyltransferase involved in capsule biosynthesis